MKFFNIDLHVSVIEDLRNIFESQGHQIVSWSISGHNWIFDRSATDVKVINSKSWKNLDDNKINEFCDIYFDFLKEFDGFVCTYPPAFSLIYERFKKPIIMQIPIRYEVPFHNKPDQWLKFNDKLRNGIDNNLIFPVANSQYDKDYFEFFVNRECDLIPNICSYTNTSWNPEINRFLYTGRLPLRSDIIVNINELGKYDWSLVSKFKGIIIIPYNCSTMSIFEHYTANIPLFCPSIDFMLELFQNHKNSVLSELTWNQTFNLKQGSSIPCELENDPNMFENLDVMKKWIQKSDFYNKDWMPHIVYFDSFEDLSYKLSTTNLVEISNSMKSFNVYRKNKINELWKKKLEKIT